MGALLKNIPSKLINGIAILQWNTLIDTIEIWAYYCVPIYLKTTGNGLGCKLVVVGNVSYSWVMTSYSSPFSDISSLFLNATGWIQTGCYVYLSFVGWIQTGCYVYIYRIPKVMLLVFHGCCGTLNSNQSKECECVMKYPLIHFNILI